MRAGAVDLARPGWSSTRGVANLEAGDHANEFSPHGTPLDVNSQSPVDMVRNAPCDR